MYDDVTYVWSQCTVRVALSACMMWHVYDDVPYVYDDVPYVYDDVTYVYVSIAMHVRVALVPSKREHTAECVLLQQNVFSYNRMCS